MGSASDPLNKRLGCSLGEIRCQWNWAPGLGFLNNFLNSRSPGGLSERVSP